MAKRLDWKVYGSKGEFVGSFRNVGLAVEVVRKCGPKATVRRGHKAVVWPREGDKDGQEVRSSEIVGLIVERVKQELAMQIQSIE